MGRLIRDADLLQGLQVVRDRETGTPRMMAEWFMTMVRDTPTAYDVEAVVRELEKLRDADVDECTEYCFIKAIDVVKRGGRNGED